MKKIIIKTLNVRFFVIFTKENDIFYIDIKLKHCGENNYGNVFFLYYIFYYFTFFSFSKKKKNKDTRNEFRTNPNSSNISYT